MCDPLILQRFEHILLFWAFQELKVLLKLRIPSLGIRAFAADLQITCLRIMICCFSFVLYLPINFTSKIDLKIWFSPTIIPCRTCWSPKIHSNRITAAGRFKLPPQLWIKGGRSPLIIQNRTRSTPGWHDLASGCLFHLIRNIFAPAANLLPVAAITIHSFD